jgi:putative membrane protein
MAFRFSTASSSFRTPFKQNRLLQICLLLFFILWVSTFIGTSNLSNWFTENTLTFLFLLGIITSYKKFKFSDLSYFIMFVYICLHVYGAKYTYAENPFGYWLKDTFHLARNHYDRIVHFSFGFLLAYPMREYFKNHFQWPNWVCWVLPCEITLSFSGAYEIIEWAVADVFFPSEGVAYLGTQGDIWDAQKDMSLAWLGSILIMLLTFLVRKLIKK